MTMHDGLISVVSTSVLHAYIGLIKAVCISCITESTGATHKLFIAGVL